MIRIRRAALLAAVLAGAALPSFAAPATSGPAAVAQNLCDALVAAMKQGTATPFPARVQLLAPDIRGDFDLPLMSRIVVGPLWRQLAPADQQAMIDAFSDYSVANYAQRFKSYSGERFEVDPTASAMPNGDSVVHTKLYTGGPEPVELDYLMRLSGDRWRIIDVFLNGTISELAARRSEYSTVLRTGGIAALVDLLKKKTAELAN
jgi:phospholipid transport system substrate-binding protein